MAFDEQEWIRQTSSDTIQAELTETVSQLLNGYTFNTAIIVNTASECGFTPQYEGLQHLFLKHRGEGLYVIGQPSNNFGGQEPGADSQIKAFCTGRYGVTFPLLPKADVVGDSATELFKALAEATGQEPKWNFHKYVVTKDKIYSFSHFQAINEEFETLLTGTLP
tara:strand:- start:101 stop:595 length:495 start_codon:yes stop_codon:yes gene_type:complete